MHKKSALFASGVLLILILVGVSLVAYALTPVRGKPSTTVIVAKTSSTSANRTALVLGISLPNRTRFTSGVVSIGDYPSTVVNGSYYFPDVAPGTYTLNVTDSVTFFAPESIKLSKGINYVNTTIYPLQSFRLVETGALTYNGTQPGPPIIVQNGTAVRVEIMNNTTQINDFAVVASLSNFSESNILFNSLSNTLSPGGSTNDTFIVNTIGDYYYTSLIGSQSKDGQYGFFFVE